MSWVVRDRASGKVMFETFNPDVVRALNTIRYEAVPIGRYLASMNPKQPETQDYPSHPECEAPGHTDLMVLPESIDKFLEDNPPPADA